MPKAPKTTSGAARPGSARDASAGADGATSSAADAGADARSPQPRAGAADGQAAATVAVTRAALEGDVAADALVGGDAGADAAGDARPDDGRWADRGVVPRPGAKRLWVVVADEAIARILQRPDDGDELESVEEITDPAAHAREGDLRRDAQGRRAGSATHGSRQNTPHRLRSGASVTASAGEDELHLEAQGFARRLAQHLGDALRQKRFDELRIVAAPRFLGHLRKELDAQVAATVTEEINKDFVHFDNSDITRRLLGAKAGGTAAE